MCTTALCVICSLTCLRILYPLIYIKGNARRLFNKHRDGNRQIGKLSKLGLAPALWCIIISLFITYIYSILTASYLSKFTATFELCAWLGVFVATAKLVLLYRCSRWRGVHQRFIPLNWREIARKRHNKEKIVEEHQKMMQAIPKRDEKRQKCIEAAGIDYQCPNFSYIVYLGHHAHDLDAGVETTQKIVEDSHCRLLGSFVGGEEKARNAIFYSYTWSINGFAAVLDHEVAVEIAKHPSVASVFPNRRLQLHTTRSWGFMDLESDGKVLNGSAWTKARFGEDVIIANLDTGVWPESRSFRDDNMGTIPSRWKGTCQNENDKDFHCSRKLIGARYFNKGYLADGGGPIDSFNSPRDVEAHGSHTLSTAGGNFVPGANLFGHANGTASGGSPRARVAAYKVCYSDGCHEADILAGFDAAIHDGVDVVSVSLGESALFFFKSAISIGSFHAIKNGITVVCSAGNDGPRHGSVSNIAPWVLTVAASTIDRETSSYLSLGNRKQLKGASMSEKKLEAGKLYPMISAVNAENAVSNQDSGFCMDGTLDPAKVKGKIVVCKRGGLVTRVEKGEVVRQAGGIGFVLVNGEENGNEIDEDPHILPAVHITYSDGETLFSYLNSTKEPVGYISYPTTKFDAKPAPFVADFSSVGPNVFYPEILKPDITAPGVNILAAYSEALSPSAIANDTRRSPYGVMSGTSMSCPHVSGVVGLVKSFHPTWSPSAIKSAIMTTARSRDNMREPITNSSSFKATPFDYGFGHIRPNRAMDPGLVYDLTTNDYLNYICAIGFNISNFQKENSSCPSEPLRIEELNYPSITIPHLDGQTTVSRMVKNVGTPGTYRAHVVSPAGTSVSVKPAILTFNKEGEEKKFEITVKAEKGYVAGAYTFGRLIWSDGRHYVRSPIVVKSGSI